MAIRLVVDSSGDLPKDMIERYGIRIVPLSVIFEDSEYLDGEELSPKEFYRKLAASEGMPSTSQVPPERFIAAFSEILEQGDDVLCITIGSGASGTCQSAMLAREELDSDRIRVIDSNMLCMGTGYLAVMAAEMIEAGHTVNEIVETITPMTKNRIEHLFCVDTLEYLKKGGRIKASKAFVAELLNIKPVLNVENAITQPIGKVRGRKKIIPYYLKHMEKTFDLDRNGFVAVAHSDDEAFARQFVEAFKDKFSWDKPVLISEIGATIGTHAGPGVLAVFYIKKS